MSSIDAAGIDVLDRYVVPRVEKFYMSNVETHSPPRPFVLGLTGLQGSGKSTWASKLVRILCEIYHYNTITVSLDDFYHEHAHLVAIARQNPMNRLLQARGQPGTHDEILATQFFDSLQYEATNGTTQPEKGTGQILVPSFDKSRFGGEGERAAKKHWDRIPKNPRIDIVVFEGWCIGFQPLLSAQIYDKWELARKDSSFSLHDAYESAFRYPTTTLQDHPIEHLETINKNLARYCSSFMGPGHFDHLAHLNTNDLQNVYEWRLQQEQALRSKGIGAMSDEAVEAFVESYMPAYELYLENLRANFFAKENGRMNASGEHRKGHVRMVLDRERRVIDTIQVS